MSITNISVTLRRWRASLNPCCHRQRAEVGFVGFVIILWLSLIVLPAKVRKKNEQTKGIHDYFGIMGSVLLIIFEVSELHIVLDSLCTSIGSIVFKCEGKDTNLFSNIQIFNAEK